jgi:ABC-2 type transport system permease protein
MTLVLFGRLLRQHGRLLGALVAGLFLLPMIVVFAAAQIEQGPGLQGMIDQLAPAGLRDFIAEQFGRVTFAGTVAFAFQHPAVIVATLAFVLVVGTVPAGERESGLLDLILARPLPRSRYFVSVLLLVLLGALALPVAALGGVALGLGLVESPEALPWHRYLPSAAGLACLMLCVGGYTLLLAVGARRRGQAASRVAGLTLLLYVIDVLGNLWKPLESIRWVSPFSYFDPIRAAILQEVPRAHTAVLLTVFVVGAGLALLRFRRQDL